MTNFQRFKSMTKCEFACERIHFVPNPDGADTYEGDFGAVDVQYDAGIEVGNSYEKAVDEEVKWLDEEADV